jgi:hypothetical protein
MTLAEPAGVASAMAEFIATPLDAALAGANDEPAAQAHALALFRSVGDPEYFPVGVKHRYTRR